MSAQKETLSEVAKLTCHEKGGNHITYSCRYVKQTKALTFPLE